jgi:hypothetical protein
VYQARARLQRVVKVVKNTLPRTPDVGFATALDMFTTSEGKNLRHTERR